MEIHHVYTNECLKNDIEQLSRICYQSEASLEAQLKESSMGFCVGIDFGIGHNCSGEALLIASSNENFNVIICGDPDNKEQIKELLHKNILEIPIAQIMPLRSITSITHEPFIPRRKKWQSPYKYHK